MNNELIARSRLSNLKPACVLTTELDEPFRAFLETLEVSESRSERVELDTQVAPIDGWQARRCALSETRNGNYTNKPAFAEECDLTKEN